MVSIRDITAEVGAAVVRAAVAEHVADGRGMVGPKDLKYMSEVCGDEPKFQLDNFS